MRRGHGPLRPANAPAATARYWPLADIGYCAAHVRYWGESGHAVLHCKCLLLTQSRHDDCNAKCPFMIQGRARPVSRSYGRYAACFTFASKRARAFFPSLAATAMLSKKTGELSSVRTDRHG